MVGVCLCVICGWSVVWNLWLKSLEAKYPNKKKQLSRSRLTHSSGSWDVSFCIICIKHTFIDTIVSFPFFFSRTLRFFPRIYFAWNNLVNVSFFLSKLIFFLFCFQSVLLKRLASEKQSLWYLLCIIPCVLRVSIVCFTSCFISTNQPVHLVSTFIICVRFVC